MLFIDKRKGDRMPENEVIPTPSLALNRALGGGLNSGATHLFWCMPSVGKTTMCFRIISQAQKMGYRPVIIDSEYSYSDVYAEKCGIDIDDVVVIQSTIVEDILKSLVPYLNHPDEKHIFLFDSLSNIIKEEFYDKPDGGKALGLQARSQGYFLQKLVNHLHKEKNIMLFVAHQTVDLSGMFAVTKAKMAIPFIIICITLLSYFFLCLKKKWKEMIQVVLLVSVLLGQLKKLSSFLLLEQLVIIMFYLTRV